MVSFSSCYGYPTSRLFGKFSCFTDKRSSEILFYEYWLKLFPMAGFFMVSIFTWSCDAFSSLGCYELSIIGSRSINSVLETFSLPTVYSMLTLLGGSSYYPVFSVGLCSWTFFLSSKLFKAIEALFFLISSVFGSLFNIIESLYWDSLTSYILGLFESISSLSINSFFWESTLFSFSLDS